jgi:coatomer subunit gamma
MALGKKEENESGELGPFTNINKTTLVLDSRVFNETPLSSKRSHPVLSKLLFVLYNGETFTTNDATTIFFNVIKIFQSKELALRRLMYVVLKEISCYAQDIMMATSSLIQDINNSAKLDATMRGDALRALGKIVDPSMVSSIERILKQAMLDKNSSTVSASLVTCIHLFLVNRDVVRRWASDVQQVLASLPRTSIAQYHALGLLCMMKQGDRVSIVKILESINALPCGPFATCLFLRLYNQSLSTGQPKYDLKGYLRGKGKMEMVSLEAARVICENPDLYEADIPYAVSALKSMLGSSRPLLRLAAIRTLNSLATSHAGQVIGCNRDIESLVSDPNRSIATFAITTLLKTGSEESVDSLVGQVSSYVNEISDEFKIVVVRAVRELCFKFPAKASSLLEFFGDIIRKEGSFAYKLNVVQSIEDLLEISDDDTKAASILKEKVLQSLCEFIEDCEYPDLVIQVIHLLGEKGPALVDKSSRIIRYIYNRMVLEGPEVRIAALQTLSKFAVLRPDLKSKIIPLLKLGLRDDDDDVRDAAKLGLGCLDCFPHEKQLYLFDANKGFDLDDLEAKLHDYLASSENFSKPFNLEGVKSATKEEVFRSMNVAGSATVSSDFLIMEEPSAIKKAQKQQIGLSDEDISTFLEDEKSLEILTMSAPALLTDSNAECVVSIIKRILLNKQSKKFQLLLEFICENTEEDLLFNDLRIGTATPSIYVQKSSNPIKNLNPFEKGSFLVLLSEFTEKSLDISCQLLFKANGLEEKFPVNYKF